MRHNHQRRLGLQDIAVAGVHHELQLERTTKHLSRNPLGHENHDAFLVFPNEHRMLGLELISSLLRCIWVPFRDPTTLVGVRDEYRLTANNFLCDGIEPRFIDFVITAPTKTRRKKFESLLED